MITISSYKCPLCGRTRGVEPPLMYDTPQDAAGVAVLTKRWLYERSPNPDGHHLYVTLVDRRKCISSFLHLCPAMGL